jgi:ABC-type sugar transport system ATPase subunit
VQQETVMRATGVRKYYGSGTGLVRAVDGIDLDVATGQTVAVMGPSGCGKSTLLHLLGGLDRPTDGEIELAGRRLGKLSEKELARVRREAVGFVFQAFHLMDELTAAENVELPALLAGRSPAAPSLTPWQGIATADGLLVAEGQILGPGAWVAGLLAVASVAVLAGGRMAEATRRVGLLKAVGSTPGLVAAVLVAENLALALAAAATGLAAGWLAAPLLTDPGAVLVGTPGAPSLTLPTAGLVVAVAFAIALAATLAPAIRAARTSTVSALADATRPPRRRAAMIALSARLPVPLLLGLRLVARRPRRALLGAASIAVTVAGIVAVLTFHATAGQRIAGGGSGLNNPAYDRDEQVLMVLTVALLVLASLNAVFTAWATVLDARQPSALARALPVPGDDSPAVARLWQAAAVLREHRGDGHFAALATADIDGCEAVVLRCGLDLRREDLQPVRGWTDEQWDDARARLADRGWIGPDGELTSAGRAAHAAVEEAIDRAASRPWERIGAEAAAELATMLAPLAKPCAGVIAYPSPIGVPAPGTVG